MQGRDTIPEPLSLIYVSAQRRTFEDGVIPMHTRVTNIGIYETPICRAETEDDNPGEAFLAPKLIVLLVWARKPFQMRYIRSLNTIR